MPSHQSQNKKKCSVDGCDIPARSNGYCNTHYQRWRRNGDPEVDRRKTAKQCSVKGCYRMCVGHGYCNTHYMRFKRHGSPLEMIPIGSSALELGVRIERARTAQSHVHGEKRVASQ